MNDLKEKFGEGAAPRELPKIPENKESPVLEPEKAPTLETESSVAPPPSVPVVPAVSEYEASKDPILKEVEAILSDDLLDVYLQMPPAAQSQFKAKGEEVAGKIQEMIRSAKVAAKEVLNLIVSWLRIIPGVNKFFIEQEAKIKTDKIMAIETRKK